jgi:7,8-dihydropterin-6-yl-methyl-4-(beta-D-ribofuranosyl)aminobenzene 5'-phosphate synthase
MRATIRGSITSLCIVALVACAGTPAIVEGPSQPTSAAPRITVLYDAFGKTPGMQKDWGYSALIEVAGKRILFDTGDNPDILARNARVKGVDLSKLDFVVMSHRHGDHMGGMSYLLEVNPNVKIYAPKENFGVYGFDLPGTFYRRAESLPAEQRYYDGAPPDTMRFGSAWPRANIELIDKTTVIAPGITLIALVSDKPTTLELKELSLAIDTAEGVVLVVGCSHAGIDRIVEAASAINKHIRMIAGGFHLVVAQDEAISGIAGTLNDVYKVDFVAPGHCTGEPTFVALRRTFGDRYLYAGLGTTIALSPVPHVVGAGPRDLAFDEAELADYRDLARREIDDDEGTTLAAAN